MKTKPKTKSKEKPVKKAKAVSVKSAKPKVAKPKALPKPAKAAAVKAKKPSPLKKVKPTAEVIIPTEVDNLSMVASNLHLELGHGSECVVVRHRILVGGLAQVDGAGGERGRSHAVRPQVICRYCSVRYLSASSAVYCPRL